MFKDGRLRSVKASHKSLKIAGKPSCLVTKGVSMPSKTASREPSLVRNTAIILQGTKLNEI